MKQRDLFFNLSIFVFIGCGGSQQSIPSQGYFNNNSKQTNKNSDSSSTTAYIQPIFLTEIDPSFKKHFWVKIHRIDLESVQQKFPAFVSEKGVWIDFGSHQTRLTQKSLYIGDTRADFIPQIVRATLTLGEKFLEQDQQGNIQKHSFALEKGQKLYRISTILNSEERKNNHKPLGLDFNLRSVILNSDNKYSLEPRICFKTDYFSTEKQIFTIFQGEAHEVMGSGASLGFLLKSDDHRTIKVIADSKTKVFTHLGSTKDALIHNRTDLQVYGEYHPTKQAFVAQWIKIVPNHNIENLIATINGKILSVDHENSTLKIAPYYVNGLNFQNLPLTVHFDKETIMINNEGLLTTGKSLNRDQLIFIEGKIDKNKLFHSQWIKLNAKEKNDSI